MTEWILTHWNGQEYTLPQPVSWKLSYGLGSPCDSFWVETLWQEGQEELLYGGVKLVVRQGSEILFTGVVDECRCQWTQTGRSALLSGRGLQALLLDNQAEAADFGQATLGEILRRYVTPYGITLDQTVTLPSVWGFSVTSGSSCWKVVYEFARYYGGVTPRFDRQGHLCLSAWGSEIAATLGEELAVTGLAATEQRYGVLSQVTVKDATGLNRQTEVNQEFVAQGGQCSRVIQMPKNTGYQARRYNAKFQLDRSQADRRLVEVTVAKGFAAWPGDLVELAVGPQSQQGTYRVRQAEVTWGEEGLQTTLTLGTPDGVL